MSKVYPHVEAGQPVEIKQGHYLKIACCDCSLVHHFEFEVKRGGTVVLRTWRDNRATGQLRRAHKRKGARQDREKARAKTSKER